jgi:hypothetical protein
MAAARRCITKLTRIDRKDETARWLMAQCMVFEVDKTMGGNLARFFFLSWMEQGKDQNMQNFMHALETFRQSELCAMRCIWTRERCAHVLLMQKHEKGVLSKDGKTKNLFTYRSVLHHAKGHIRAAAVVEHAALKRDHVADHVPAH